MSSEADLDVFAKLFEERLGRCEESEAFSRGEVVGEEDLLEFGVVEGVGVEMPGELASKAPACILDGAFPDGTQNYWKSKFARQLSDEAFEVIVEHADKMRSSLSAVVIEFTAAPRAGSGVPGGFRHKSAGVRSAMPFRPSGTVSSSGFPAPGYVMPTCINDWELPLSCAKGLARRLAWVCLLVGFKYSAFCKNTETASS